jgi:hypothetical protein
MMAGADHVKICTSGGVLSPTDKIDSSQFTVPEIKVICETVKMMVRRPTYIHVRELILLDRAGHWLLPIAIPTKGPVMLLKVAWGGLSMGDYFLTILYD